MVRSGFAVGYAVTGEICVYLRYLQFLRAM